MNLLQSLSAIVNTTAIADSDVEQLKAWSPIVVGCIAAVVAIITTLIMAIVQIRQNAKINRHNAKQLELQLTKLERDRIQGQLESFYSPMIGLRTESRILYDYFALTEKRKAEQQGAYFKTLVFLVEGGTLDSHDRALLDEIVSVGKAQLELIERYSASLDSRSLTELLGRLACHIRMLQLAATGNMRGLGNVVGSIVYPSEVDGALESSVRKLKDKLSGIDGRPPRDPKAAGAYLDSRTIAYYNGNADDYLRRTAGLDVKALLDRFLRLVPRGGLILDAGCGVGRDTRYMIGRGYRVVSFDASSAMVEKCAEYPFAYCVQLGFNEVLFTEEFDGVWACASLLHLDSDAFDDALRRLARAVKQGGSVYFSLKSGSGSQRSGGRFFTYYSRDEVCKRISIVSSLELVDEWENSSALPGDLSPWMNFICRKKRLRPPIKDEAPPVPSLAS